MDQLLLCEMWLSLAGPLCRRGIMSTTEQKELLEKEDEERVEDVYPWKMWQRVVMLATAFFVSAMMSGVTVGHIGIQPFALSLLTSC